MTFRSVAMLCFVFAVCIMVRAQTEPSLSTVKMPKYPDAARQARIEGVVKVTFTLPANAGEPTDIVVASGHPALTETTLQNVKTWRFENPYAVERKYETTFRYRFSGASQEPVPYSTWDSVTFESFPQVDIVTELIDYPGIEL